MPVFNLQLEFDEHGAVTAARQLDRVADAADNVQGKFEKAGKSGNKALNEISDKSTQARKALELVSKYTKLLGSLQQVIFYFV